MELLDYLRIITLGERNGALVVDPDLFSTYVHLIRKKDSGFIRLQLLDYTHFRIKTRKVLIAFTAPPAQKFKVFAVLEIEARESTTNVIELEKEHFIHFYYDIDDDKPFVTLIPLDNDLVNTDDIDSNAILGMFLSAVLTIATQPESC